ncbi:ankyrin repeat domain-containing protein SOWAHD-like isoform X1 [Anguilla anguilla]|uniref:ankyrin repeat domain-containing protein SOWAHD-like isoform X1 n=2 Tax=Anguilla anguilla TaxID=7936 RepID=UPI0015AAA8BC|nr:ankyrin repeat domain-containing protein SOWAHD-like isoform X1 [Anguilla anguilla]
MSSHVGISESTDMTCRPNPDSQSELAPAQNGDGFRSDTSTKASHDSPRDKSSGDRNATLEQRASNAATAAIPTPLPASVRRYRLQKQQETSELYSGSGTINCPGVPRKLSAQAPEKGSMTSGMRKKYLKELLLTKTGLSSLSLSFDSAGAYSKDLGSDGIPSASEESANFCAFWALDPTEHAWMLAVVDGNFDIIVDYLSTDSSLLTKKDFVTGFTVLHWLAKYGKHNTLIKLLKHAENEGFAVDVNIKASGGYTPLHVAVMHGQYMIVKLLVGAFCASVDAMDYSGRRAWQYLRTNASAEIKELLGAMDGEGGRALGYKNANNNCVATARYLQEVPNGEEDSSVTRNQLCGLVRKFIASFMGY